MNSSEFAPAPPKTSSGRIVLKISGLGHVPSKKNSKQFIPGKGKRRAMLITKPEYQKWIERCIRSFESQLLSLLRTGGAEMLMEPNRRSLIFWLNQFDDSVQWIVSERIDVEMVPMGEEGAIVILEQL
jgi:hypothetical protein